MRFLILVLGALSLFLEFPGGVVAAPRLVPRSSAFVSPPGAVAAAAAPRSVSAASAVEGLSPFSVSSSPAASETRCYACPIFTFGGGPRGGGEGEGRVALVTGASRGIGLAIAKKLAQGGVETVLCVARDQASCDAAAAEVRSLGAVSEGFGVDVGDKTAVGDLCRSLLEKYKRIDILVNNAGITRDSLFIRMKESDWADVLRTNLDSAFYFSQPIIKSMSQRRFGRVLNMASVVGVSGNVGQANYAASKAGLIGLTKSLAKEYANRNVTVNAIAPGFIKSAMTDLMTDQAKAAALSAVAAGRLGTPEEVASLAAFLASDQAAYINGRVIAIEGASLFGGQ